MLSRRIFTSPLQRFFSPWGAASSTFVFPLLVTPRTNIFTSTSQLFTFNNDYSNQNNLGNSPPMSKSMLKRLRKQRRREKRERQRRQQQQQQQQQQQIRRDSQMYPPASAGSGVAAFAGKNNGHNHNNNNHNNNNNNNNNQRQQSQHANYAQKRDNYINDQHYSSRQQASNRNPNNDSDTEQHNKARRVKPGGTADKYVKNLGRIKVVRSVFQINLEDEAEVRSYFATFGLRCEPEQEMCGGLKACRLDIPIPLSGPMLEHMIHLGGHAGVVTVDELKAQLLKEYENVARAPRAFDQTRNQTETIHVPNNLHQINNNNNNQSASASTTPVEIRYFRVRGVAANSAALASHLCYSHAAKMIQCLFFGRHQEAFQYGAFVFKSATNLPIQNPDEPQDYSGWSKYAEACRVYASEQLAAQQQDTLERGSCEYTVGREPTAESLLKNLVQKEQQTGSLPESGPSDVVRALGLPAEPKLLQIRSGGAWLSVIQMPNHPNLHAIGVSGSKKVSTNMCCLHAIQLGRAYPPIPPEKLAQVRIQSSRQREDQIAKYYMTSQGISPARIESNLENNDNHITNNNSTLQIQEPVIMRYPLAKKVFQLFTRIGIVGTPLVHSTWVPEEGCYVAKIARPLLNNNNNNNISNLDTDPTISPSATVIVAKSATNPEEAKMEAYSLYFESAIKIRPELEKFHALVAGGSHSTVDSEDILNVNLNPNILRKISEAAKHLGSATKEDQAAEAGRLAPEMRLDRATLRLRCHLTKNLLASNGVRTKDELAQRMIQQLRTMRQSNQYLKQFGQARASLPIVVAKDEILEKIQNNRVVIINASTGSGKTTQVAQYLLDHHIEKGEGPDCSILITQPRRISAISISERIAAERCESVGDSTGYTIRLDSRPGKNITLLTTGVLLQLLRVDPALRGVKYLIIDEIHERDLHCDFSLILAREALALNPDLRVICMSATLQSDTFSKYFGDAPVVNAEGRLFPVKEYYLEDLPQLSSETRIPLPPPQNRGRSNSTAAQVDPFIVAATIDICIQFLPQGTSILVFVAGWKDISEVQKACQQRCKTSSCHDYVLLHSTITKEQQMKAFRRAPAGRIKIVIATNIAESGITIDDVGAVIDCGVTKEMSCTVSESTTTKNIQQHQSQNQTNNSNETLEQETGSVFQLRSVPAAQANCTQRLGRAGRTQGGLCFRLFTRQNFKTRRSYQVPEMLRMPLEQIILQSIAMGYGDPTKFFAKAVDPPSPRLLAHSIRQLRALGAIHDDFQLTWLGHWIVKMPTEPAKAKMILLGAMLRCLDPVLTVAAASDAPILVRAIDERPKVNQCRASIGLTTLSDSVTDVMVVNSIVRDYVLNSNGARTGRQNSNNNNNNNNNNKSHHPLPVPQPPESAKQVPKNLINWKSFDVLTKYKAQFFNVLLTSGWHVSWQNAHEERNQMNARNNSSTFFVDVSSASQNASEVELLKAVIACSLYPQVALADGRKQGKAQVTGKNGKKQTTNKQKTKWIAKTKLLAKVPFGRASVANHVATKNVATSLHSRMFTFRSVFDIGGTEFLDDVNHTNIWALLLLAAGEDHITFFPEFGVGMIDSWIVFKSDPQTMEALKTMRVLLNRCFGRLLRGSNEELQRTNEVLSEVREVIKIILCQENAENLTYLGDGENNFSGSDAEGDNEEKSAPEKQQGTTNNGDDEENDQDDDINEDDLEHE